MSALDEIRSRFQNDRFATEVTGIVIDLAEPGKAVCSLTLTERHMNENHVPMAGLFLRLLILPAPLRLTVIPGGRLLPSARTFPLPILRPQRERV